MNILVWIAAGAMLAWLSFAYIGMNRTRGLLLTLVIGVAGAYFGGSVVAPLLGQAAVGGEFRPFASVVAAACAGAFLVLSDMVYEQFGV